VAGAAEVIMAESAEEQEPALASSPPQRLKRSGSWRRFKESVKETFQGLVGSKHQAEADEDTPSALRPQESNKTIDVKHVLHGTNCYAGGKIVSDPGFLVASTPESPTTLLPPTIVVTDDERPQRPTRRTSSKRRADNGQSQHGQIPSVRQPQQQQQQQPQRPTTFLSRTPPQTPSAAAVSLPASSASTPGGGSPEEDVEAVKKRLAVLKIKQALFNMRNAESNSSRDDTALLLRPSLSSSSPTRRFSDVSCSDVEAVSVAINRRQSQTQQLQQPKVSPAAVRRSRSAAGATGAGRPVVRVTSGGGGGSRRKSAAELPRAQSMKAKKAKPMIWEHFESLPHTNAQAVCRKCRMTISCRYNTGNFVRHLQVAHMDVYRQYQNKIETQWTQSMLARNLK